MRCTPCVHVLGLWALALVGLAAGAPPACLIVTAPATGATGRATALTTRIEPYGANALRVRTLAPGQASFLDNLTSALIPPPDGVRAPPHQPCKPLAAPANFTNGNLRCEVDAAGRLTFTRLHDGRVLLKEASPTAFGPSKLTPPNPRFSTLDLHYSPFPGERVYGLGQHKGESGSYALDNMGRSLSLNPKNTEILIPVVSSSRGYCYLFNLPALGTVEYSNTTGYAWHAEAVLQADVWVATTPAAFASSPWQSLQASYTNVTGRAPVFPAWATGFWQSKNRYHNQSQVMAIVDGHLSRQIPISMIIIDYYSWAPSPLGDETMNRACWPDPRAMVEQLAAKGVQVMLSPYFHSVQAASSRFAAAKAQGFLALNASGQPSPIGYDTSYTYDLFQPEARAFAWGAVQGNYIEADGLANFWLDCDEPCGSDAFDDAIYNRGQWPAAFAGAAYPHVMYEMVYEQLPGPYRGNRVVLGRSAWAGSQRFGAAVWSGDTHSDFNNLNQQFRAGLNMALSGIPYWTTDIGGYSGGNIDDPYFRQEVTRWFQYGAFCPLFRNHGHRSGGPSQEGGDPSCGASNSANEIWQFGPDAYQAIKDVMLLRESLRPYIAGLYKQAASSGRPIITPLFYDFPDDPGSADVQDQMLFGPDWLVCPQMVFNASNRSVYLPPLDPAFLWQNYFSKETFNTTTGGRTIVVSTPFEGPGLATFPLFFKYEPTPAPPPPPPLPPCGDACTIAPHTDASGVHSIASYPSSSDADCCARCKQDTACHSFVRGPDPRSGANTCYLLGPVRAVVAKPDRNYGCVRV